MIRVSLSFLTTPYAAAPNTFFRVHAAPVPDNVLHLDPAPAQERPPPLSCRHPWKPRGGRPGRTAVHVPPSHDAEEAAPLL
jgi:hypothetical protein